MDYIFIIGAIIFFILSLILWVIGKPTDAIYLLLLSCVFYKITEKLNQQP